jgi:hypothetical protein
MKAELQITPLHEKMTDPAPRRARAASRTGASLPGEVHSTTLAYLEEDGHALCVALLAAVVALTVALAAVWQTVLGAKWISGLL